MKALTVRQPWAELIASGVKVYETRSWSTSYRGPLAIHAGAAAFLWPAGLLAAAGAELEARPGRMCGLPGDAAGRLFDRARTRGAVVCVVELLDVVPVEELAPTLLERGAGDWSPGRFAWRVRLVERLAEPAPCKGRLGLWEWTPPPGVVIRGPGARAPLQ